MILSKEKIDIHEQKLSIPLFGMNLFLRTGNHLIEKGRLFEPSNRFTAELLMQSDEFYNLSKQKNISHWQGNILKVTLPMRSSET